jgi:hypothetical protein
MGEGYVDIFNLQGELVENFIDGDYLNNPTALFQLGPGLGYPCDSLGIVNGGNGTIVVYSTSGVGKYLGKMIFEDGVPVNVGNSVSVYVKNCQIFIGQLKDLSGVSLTVTPTLSIITKHS